MSRAEPRWLGRLAIDEAHFRQIREHGGRHGLRDENALESALARPGQRWGYDEAVTIPDLAAAYAFGLIRDHPYVDGNKRIGLVAMVAFLDRNGHEMTASDTGAVEVIRSVAAGDLSETALAEWVASRARPAGGSS
jgi:death-on-curing protein